MKPGKNIVYKVFILSTVVVLIAVTFFCSKKKEETDQYQARPRKTRSLEPAIAKVELDPPQPISADDIKAVPVLKDPTMTYVTYRYQWFVNGDIIQGKDNPLLEKKYYKKGDNIYCRVQALRGVYESKIVRSEETRIKNAPPVIKFVPPGFVNIPGRFHYTINASDYDGDSLTYRLVSPLDMGIQVDPKTGEIVWNIPAVPKPKPEPVNISSREGEGEGGSINREGAAARAKQATKKKDQLRRFVKIVFEVRDTDGAAAVSSIKLDLSPGRGSPR